MPKLTSRESVRPSAVPQQASAEGEPEVSKQPTVAELQPRIAKAKADTTNAVTAHIRAQEAHEQLVIAADSELNVAKAKRAVDEAKAKIETCQEQLRMLEGASEQAFGR